MAVTGFRPRIVETLDALNFIADVLMGLNVRFYNYVADVEESFCPYTPDPDAEWHCVPFGILIWDDGMDYNDDGTAYRDDFPGDWLHSTFSRRKDAEMEVSWLEHHGVEPRRITFVEDHWVRGYELRNHPIKD